ncbi:oligopeptide transporter 7 [Hyphopichia burtonii NRRL Y-1933]|uniref:Oligopeptide transporter 7 n=1 Tax=Hyphopichia burtonii NRRL Y-1933 TaxID=984485 RepID=A0A1E4RFF7_9ASCO|nr:oligopeptide transporter 7 [Hyphopichia burtonii NRRL Y-1933]ODV66002.1 oligopeptide transporter 7 [Hyphopichia burtonii NRRL Y-1933]
MSEIEPRRDNRDDLLEQDSRGENDQLLPNGQIRNRSTYKATGQGDILDGDEGDGYEDVLELPQPIRETVPLEDDPSIPVLTFRYLLLSTIFVIPGAFIDTINSFRTTSVPYSIFFVQIAGHWAGKWLAKALPNKRAKVMGVEFNLNPGPWSIKETALLTITAKSGATGNLATNALSMTELHFNERLSSFASLGIMFAAVFIGYSYSIIPKNLVLYDPQYLWPQSLMQTALLQSQAKSGQPNGKSSNTMKVFFFAVMGMTIWQLFPELIFPLMSSVALLCYLAPTNKTLNFIGSGIGGMGLLNFSFDWANISSSIMLYPYYIQVIEFIAFVVGAWVLIPLVKFSNISQFKDQLMSNKIFTGNGTLYPTDKLITPDYQLNLTAYEIYGPVYLGPQKAWNMFFEYAAYVSGIVWILSFGYDNLKQSFFRYTKNNKKGPSGNFTDRLNKLNSQYQDIPLSWYLTLLLLSLAILLILNINGKLFMPWWCCIIALISGGLIVTPLIWLYAMSNFQLPIGTFNELFYGYLVESVKKKHAAGASFYSVILGNAWYRCQHHLESRRLGFYNHIPSRAVFFAQIYGEIIGVPFNYLAMRYVLDTKRDFIDGTKIDPIHQWSGQDITSMYTNSIQYVILGPSRLFKNYPFLPYGFLVGLLAPLLIFQLHCKYSNSPLQFNLWNTTVFFSRMGRFYGNISTGYLSKFLGGTVTMLYAYRYKHDLWKRYNYILAASFDTGLNLSILIIYFFGFQMPNWWGNDPRSVERCFAY